MSMCAERSARLRGDTWVLGNATDVALVTTAFTTPDALKAAAEKPLGSQKLHAN
jgi:hypothetical protein